MVAYSGNKQNPKHSGKKNSERKRKKIKHQAKQLLCRGPLGAPPRARGILPREFPARPAMRGRQKRAAVQRGGWGGCFILGFLFFCFFWFFGGLVGSIFGGLVGSIFGGLVGSSLVIIRIVSVLGFGWMFYILLKDSCLFWGCWSL